MKFFLILSLTTLAAHTVVIDRVVAIVGKDPILLSETLDDPKIIDKLVIDKLISIDLKKSGQEVSSHDIDEAIKGIRRQHNLTEEQFKQALAGQKLSMDRYRSQLKEQIQHMKLIQGKIKNRIQISDEDVQAAYDKKYGTQASNVKLHLKHLLFKSKKSADHVLQQTQPGMSFATITKMARTIDKNVVAGDFGQVSRGDLIAEVEDLAFALEQGKLGGPVETPEGQHLLYVQEQISTDKIPLEKVRKDLHKELFDEEVEREFQRYVDELKSKTYIEVRESVLK